MIVYFSVLLLNFIEENIYQLTNLSDIEKLSVLQFCLISTRNPLLTFEDESDHMTYSTLRH